MAGDASVDLIVFDTHTIERDGTQQDWLRARVADSTADWLIVTAHAPIYSTGWHGMRYRARKALAKEKMCDDKQKYLAVSLRQP